MHTPSVRSIGHSGFSMVVGADELAFNRDAVMPPASTMPGSARSQGSEPRCRSVEQPCRRTVDRDRKRLAPSLFRDTRDAEEVSGTGSPDYRRP